MLLDGDDQGGQPGEHGDGSFQWHPDIKDDAHYLARIDDGFFAGTFSEEWYGWSFDGWGGGGGLQLDKPGTNASSWQGLWEIVPQKGRK